MSLEHEHVAAAGRLRLDEVFTAIDGDAADDGLVEAKRSLGVTHVQRDVRQTERLHDHGGYAGRRTTATQCALAPSKAGSVSMRASSSSMSRAVPASFHSSAKPFMNQNGPSTARSASS